jgi:integrase
MTQSKLIPDVPRYLCEMIASKKTGVRDWVGRRCMRYLTAIWTGLQTYTNCPLETALEWDTYITVLVLQNWYNRLIKDSKQAAQGSNYFRWIRYTLNRLVLGFGAKKHPIIQHGRRDPTERVIPLRLSQLQEDTVMHIMTDSTHEWSMRERYVLRRFVASFPIWDRKQFMCSVSKSTLEWWIRERMRLVVPSIHVRWFPSALVALIGWISPPASCGSSFQPPLGLLYPPSEGLDVGTTMPYHCAVFFRHYFKTDPILWVKDMGRIFWMSGCTHIHIRQMWDECKDFWLFHCCGSGEDFMGVVLPRITTMSINEWLLDVYRRTGGGGQINTPCIKALSALRFLVQTEVIMSIGLTVPCRTQYNALLRRTWSQEEISVLEDSRSTPLKAKRNTQCRTYRDDECQRLLSTCETDRDRVLMLLLQRVALRNTAIRTLRLCDVFNMDLGSVRPVCEAAEKGGTTRRFCLDPESVRCLMAYMENEYPNPKITPEMGSLWLFPRNATEMDQCISPSQVHWWFRKLCHAANVSGPHCTMHQFRHYLVTKLMKNKSNTIENVSQWIGHTSVHTTCKHYWLIDVKDLHHRLVFPWLTDNKP